MNLEVLQQLTGVLLSGYFTHFNRDQWRKVVQDSFNQVPMVITTFAHLQTLQGLIVNTHLKPKFVLGPYKLLVELRGGRAVSDHEVMLWATGATPLPDESLAGMFVRVVPERGASTPVPSASTLAIDCTGLGGHDLGGPPFDICLRADKHGQSIYGPSGASLETQRYENQCCFHVVALGWTKAMHEFLVLHYMATDSAQGWEDFLGQCVPNGTWMPAAMQTGYAHEYV